MTVEERLERVERELAQAKRRSMALAAAICVLGGAWVLWLSIDTVEAQAAGTPEVVRAHRFEVVDEDGKTRATLAVHDRGPRLRLFDENGTPRAEVAAAKDGEGVIEPGLWLYDNKGQWRVALHAVKNEPRLSLNDDEPRLGIYNKKGVRQNAPQAAPAAGPQNVYAGTSAGHWIKENIGPGEFILLEDGSLWKIDPLDKIDAYLWLRISNITVIDSSDGSPGYDYLLINTDDGEKAHGKYMGQR